MNFFLKVYQLLKDKKFWRFCLVGFSGTVSNLAVFFVARKFLHTGINLAAVVAFAFAVTQNYYFNSKWTFRHVSSGSLKFDSYFKYVGVNIFSLAVNLLTVNLILKLVWPAFSEILAQAAGIVLGFVLTYLGTSVLVFVEKEQQSKKFIVFSPSFLNLRSSYKLDLLVFLLIFFISFCSQVVAVIGSKSILEPLSIDAKNKDGLEPHSFERFMQLARAENFTLIKSQNGQSSPVVENVFIKNIFIGISEVDLSNLTELSVKLGEKKFSYSKSQFFSVWQKVDPQVLNGNLSGREDSTYKFYRAPQNLRFSTSRIPVYKNFFSSIINWGGDDLLLQKPLVKSLSFAVLAIALLILCRIIFMAAVTVGLDFFAEVILQKQKRYIIFSLSIYFSLFFLLLLNGLVIFFYKPNIIQILGQAKLDYVAYIFKSIRPKPVERLQFLVNTLAAPFILLFSYVICRRLVINYFDRVLKWYKTLVCLNAFLAFSLIYLALAVSGFFFVNDSFFAGSYGRFIYALIIFPTLLYFFLKNKIPEKVVVLLNSLGFLAVFVVFCLGVTNLKNGYVPVDLDPVIYPQMLVRAGYSLLAPITSFYGLYPFFLKPIFMIFGFSVLKFSLVMSVIMAGCFGFIYKALKYIVKDKMLAALGFLAVIFYTVLATRTMPEYYFQYWPIRFLFPAVGLYLTSVYFKTKSLVFYWVCFGVFALGILWNLDVGLVLFLAFLLSLIFSELGDFKNFKSFFIRAFKHILSGLFSLAVICGFFALATFIQSGRWPDFSLLTRYQKLFLAGYLNIPLVPPPHMWFIIIFIYLAALLVCAGAIYKKTISYSTIIIFYLALLGFGLFAYFEGQSSDITLFRTSYPAIILSLMFIDTLWVEVKSAGFRLYGEFIIVLLGLFILFSVPLSLLVNAPKYFNFVAQAIENIKLKDSEMLRDTEFIKNHSAKNERVFILASPYQGPYYVESQTQPILETASIADIVFPKDMQVVINFLQENKTVKVFVKLPLENYDKFDPRIKQIIVEKYKSLDKGGEGISLSLPK